MALHFNLRGLFLFMLGVMGGWLLLPYPLLAGISVLGLYLLICYKKITVADCVFSVALGMNLWYALYSMGNVRQYDYFNFFMHADYFIRNDFFLARPITFFQEVYFQPPLWGLVCALVTKMGMLCQMAQEQAFDGVRFVSLFCVSGAGVIFWRLTGEFGFSDNVRLGLLVLFCFFPANGLAANLVNNDAMVYFLMIAAINEGYLWYIEGKWRQAGVLAGLLFVAGMIKFSGLMIVPALGALGVCRLIEAKNKRSLSLWGQFGVIGLGAVLGFGWGLFLLYFNFPLVSPPMNVEFQDLSGVALGDRFFSLDLFLYPFAEIRGGRIEVNVFLTLVKTALFGEWGWAEGFFAYALYFLGIGLALLLVFSFFFLWRYKLGKNYAFNLFSVVLVFSVLISWVGFWLEYPYFCSVEFRYVMILLPVSLLWFGNWLTQKSLPKWFNYTLRGCLALFVLAKFMLYLNTI